MNVVFADTSFYVSLLTRQDVNRQRARKLADEYNGKIVTTGWILLELANHFSPVANRPAVLTLFTMMRSGKDVEIVPTSQSDFDDGIDLYSQRRDKSWSLVDCISFIVMRREGIADAWTADHHFTQAGFRALLV